MDKKLIIILGIILVLVLLILAVIFGPVCVSDSTCKKYCYEKGSRGVISYQSECNWGICECTCPSGDCD
ncbi:hypothetical protein KY348_02570 [Candidatus Woesearchaeota archaeon]|nr:hypothetical protein [Candidatus Woesearchaeota archaeon]